MYIPTSASVTSRPALHSSVWYSSSALSSSPFRSRMLARTIRAFVCAAGSSSRRANASSSSSRMIWRFTSILRAFAASGGSSLFRLSFSSAIVRFI